MPRIPSTINTQTGKVTNVGIGAPLEKTGARATDDAQTKARGVTAPVRALPWADGNLITGVKHGATSQTFIQHKLGRAARGAFPVNIVGSAITAWIVTSLGTAADGTIIAATQQICTVDWWIY